VYTFVPSAKVPNFSLSLASQHGKDFPSTLVNSAASSSPSQTCRRPPLPPLPRTHAPTVARLSSSSHTHVLAVASFYPSRTCCHRILTLGPIELVAGARLGSAASSAHAWWGSCGRGRTVETAGTKLLLLVSTPFPSILVVDDLIRECCIVYS
jgi:hypothetical protein